jgi:biotin carboxyl carrier protein
MRAAIAPQEYENALRQRDVDAQRVAEARATLELVRSGARQEQLEAAGAQVRSLEAVVAGYRADVGRTTVVSPIAGRVVTARVEEQVGWYVRPGQRDVIAEIEDGRTMRAEVEVPEEDSAGVVGRIAVGVGTTWDDVSGHGGRIAPVAARGWRRRRGGDGAGGGGRAVAMTQDAARTVRVTAARSGGAPVGHDRVCDPQQVRPLGDVLCGPCAGAWLKSGRGSRELMRGPTWPSSGWRAQSPDLATFWHNILARVDAISIRSISRRVRLRSGVEQNDRVYARRGGPGRPGALRSDGHEVMPRADDGGEPEHFVALGLAHAALADAGLMERAFPRERTAIILGRGTYVNRGMIAALQHGIVVDQTIRLLAALDPGRPPAQLERLRRLLKAQLPPFNSETAQSLAHSAMCGRIANRFDLMGPAYTVDAACASSLIAVEQAMKELRDGTCDLALAGGIQVSRSSRSTLPARCCRAGRLRSFTQADGRYWARAGILVLSVCRAGAAAIGYTRGEGRGHRQRQASDGRAHAAGRERGLAAPSVHGRQRVS